VKEPTIDDERLAALLDGRLDGREREELLARLAGAAEDDDDYLVFADAAAVLREREEAAGVTPLPIPVRAEESASPSAGPEVAAAPHEDSRDGKPASDTAKVVPLRPRRRFPVAAWGALAAVLAGVALIPVLRARAGDPYDPARLASRLETSVPALPAGWARAERPWGAKRGGSPDRLTEEGRSARLGALLVDLEVAVRARDTASTAAIAGTVKALLEGFSTGYVVQTYDSIARAPDRPREQLEPLLKDGRQDVAEIFDPVYFRAGAWTEAGLLAAAKRDADFFRRRDSRRELEAIAAIPAVAQEARAVQAAIPDDRAPDWNAVDTNLTAILKELGR
jgi:hypothetical protein